MATPSLKDPGAAAVPKPTSTAACQAQAATHVGHKSSWLFLANTHLQPVARENPCLFADAARSGALQWPEPPALFLDERA